jgi:hypothetical protein
MNTNKIAALFPTNHLRAARIHPPETNFMKDFQSTDTPGYACLTSGQNDPYSKTALTILE